MKLNCLNKIKVFLHLVLQVLTGGPSGPGRPGSPGRPSGPYNHHTNLSHSSQHSSTDKPAITIILQNVCTSCQFNLLKTHLRVYLFSMDWRVMRFKYYWLHSQSSCDTNIMCIMSHLLVSVLLNSSWPRCCFSFVQCRQCSSTRPAT